MMEENQCRICLQQLEENAGKNIFKTRVNGEKPLCDYFQLLFDFKVHPDNNLPNLICEKCLLSIELYLNLRKQAIENNETLLRNQAACEVVQFEEPENVDFEDCSSETNEEETDAVAFLLKNIKPNTEIDLLDIKNSTVVAEEHENRRFVCKICEKKFLKRSNLVDHLKIHANSRNFRCSICDKSFIQLGNLRTHMRVHTKHKPYKCKLCEKSYTQASALKIHMRTHSNEKIYKCPFCNKGFTNASDLGKHKKIHDPEKDYLCKECQRQFTQKVHAKKHIQKVHPDADIDGTLVKRREKTLV